MKKYFLLKYLFIASLINIIIQISQNIYNLTQDPQERILNAAEKIKNKMPSMAEKLETIAYNPDAMKYIKTTLYFNLLFLILSLVAVSLMWQLKFLGWYLYLLSELGIYLFYIFTWNTYKQSQTEFNTYISAIQLSISFAFDVLFIGLYYYALKQSFLLQQNPSEPNSAHNSSANNH